MKRFNYFLTTILAFASVFGAKAQLYGGMTADQKVRYAEKIIENYYLDPVDGDKLAQEAIVAMLKTLDPHSTYSDPEETKELTTPLDGNFSGIGVQFNMLNDTLFVIQTTAGGPSEKVGILPGDRILQAGDSLISGVKSPNSRVLRILRGPKGSKVVLKVLRKGEPKPLYFNIIRDDIPVYSVDAAYMADPTTGYIRVARFGEETDREFTQALYKLLGQGMQNLIIDLEDNGGGYLNAAHELASHFLQRGDLVVSTEAPKMGRNELRVDRNGNFRTGRVVVMANQYSASASEILSGAIQDNDRGLVVGRRTFGKGLVQRPFPFPDGSMIRLTVSRYLTPSGRSIQKPYTAGDEDDYRKDMLNRYEAGEFTSADSVHLPDSLRFETLRNRRPVYGGGGIMPDLFVPIDTTAFTNYYRDLVAKGILNRYAITYVDDHRDTLKKKYPTEEAFLGNFKVTPEMLQTVVDMGVRDSIAADTTQLERSRDMICTIIKGIIGRDLFTTETYFKVTNPALNPIYRQALDLINDEELYYRLLKVGR